MAVNIGPKIGIDGEKQYRQEMQNIIQQGKTLAAEMDSVSSAFNNADASEKDYSKVTEKLNEQIANQQKLVEKMRDAVEKSAQATGENSTETLKWKEQLAKAEKGLSDLEGKAKNAAGGIDDLGKEEKETGEQTSIFGDVLKANLASEAIKKGIEMTVSAVKDVAKFFVEAIKGAAEYADEINTLSKTTGMSTDALQEYKYAADLLDVDLNTITGSVQRLKKSMDSAKDGTGATADAFAELGVNVTDSNGNLRDADKVFDDVINALKEIENPTERDAVAMKVLGKSAADLNPLIEAGAGELNALRKEAHKVGAVLDGETLDTLNSVQDGFDRLKGTFEALKRTLGTKLGGKILPDLEKLVGLFQSLAESGDLNKFTKDLSDWGSNLIRKIPDYTRKITKELPKVIKSIGKELPKLLGSLAKSIGETLGQSFKNLPELLKAGAILIGRLIEGVVMFVPNLVKGIVDGFKNGEIEAAQRDLIEKYQGVRDAIGELKTPTEKVSETMTDFIAKQKEAEHWVQIFKEISEKTNPTAADLNVMNNAAEKLNEIFPELGLEIDKETGKWNLSTEAIRENIKALELRARAEAYGEAAKETLQEIAKLDVQRDEYRRKRRELENERKKLQDDIAALQATYDAITSLDPYTYGNLEENAKFYELISEYAGHSVVSIEEAESILSDLNEEIRKGNETISVQTTEIDELGKTIETADTKLAELNADAENFFRKQTAIEARAETYGKKIVGMLGDGAEKEAPVLNNRMQKLIADTVNTLEGDVQEETSKVEKSGKLIGVALLKGARKGIDTEKAQFIKDAGASITAAIERMKKVAMIQSPSKVTEKLIGQNLALGVVKGWDDIFDGSRMRNAFSLNGAFGAMRGNTTNTTNLGGVNITVNAAQGQDANTIANIVMQKMQGQVNARRAVFA